MIFDIKSKLGDKYLNKHHEYDYFEILYVILNRISQFYLKTE